MRLINNTKRLIYIYLTLFYVGSVSFLLNIFIARSISPEKFVDYSYGVSCGLLMLLMFDFGIKTLLQREIGKIQSNFSMNVLMSFTMSHFVFFLLSLFVLFIFFKNIFFFSIGICFLLISFVNFISSINKGKSDYRSDFFWQIITRTVSAILIFLVIYLNYETPLSIFLAWAFGLLISILICKKYLFFSFCSFQKLFLKQKKRLYFYKLAYIFFLIDLFTFLYFRSDIIFLKNFKVENLQIATYALCFRFVEILNFAAYPFLLFFINHYKQFKLQTLDEINKLIIIIFLAFFIGCLFTIFFATYSFEILSLIYGRNYGHSSQILKHLSLIFIFILPNSFLSLFFIAQNNEMNYLRAAILASIVNISINICFIRFFGVMASVYGAIFSELALFSYSISFIYSEYFKNRKKLI